MRPNLTHFDARLIARLERFAGLAAAVTTLSSLLALIGLALNLKLLGRLFPGAPAIQPIAAVALGLAGTALWFLRAGPRRLASVCAGAAAAIGAVGLLQAALGADLGLYRLFFQQAPPAEVGQLVGHPVPAASVCLLLLGLALLTLNARRAWLAPLLSLPVLLVAGLALVIFAYEAAIPSLTGPSEPIAPYAATALVLLALGVLSARPAGPITGALTSSLAGGGIGRRLLPAAFVVPFALGWLWLLGQRLGFYDTEFVTALFATATIVIFAGLIYWSTRLLNQADARRVAVFEALRDSEERLRLVADAAPNGLIMVSAGGGIVWANRQSELLFGYGPGQLLGQAIEALVPSKFRGGHPGHRQVFAADRQARMMGAGRDLFGRRQDGAEFPVEIGLSPVAGSPDGLTLASVIDIAERKRAEASLLDSHAMLSSIIASVDMPIFAVDTRFCYTAFNAAHAATMQALYGAQIEIGHSLLDYQTVAADRGGARANIERALAGERLVQADTSGEESRSQRYFEVSHNPIRSHTGAIIGVAIFAVDTSDRVEAEKALQRINAELERRVEQRTAELAANEAKFRTLFNVLPVGVSIVDSQRRVVDHNPALERILKITPEALAPGGHAGRKIIRLDGSPLPDTAMPSARAFAEQRPIPSVEMGIITETGETIWTNVSAAPLPVAGLGVVIVTADITENKRIEDALRASRQRFESAYTHAPIGIGLVDLNGHWLQANPALCHMVGYTEDELLTISFQTITHPDDLASDLGYLREMLAGTIQTYQMEKRYFHKLGHVVWVVLSVSLMRDPAGQPEYFISQIQDITQRKQAETTLAHERDLMQALMDNIPDTIYFKDTQSRFTRINQAQARFLGLSGPEAAVGRTDLDYQEPVIARDIYAEEQRLFATGQPVLNRIDFSPTRDGQPRWISSTKVPLKDAAGRVSGLVGVSRDVTAVKQAEAQLVASLQEKEVLLKEIHHRVKNNLQVVSSMLRLQADSLDDPALRELFDDSQRRVRAMALIHEQLYRSHDLAHIHFEDYVNGLVVTLRRSHARAVSNVTVRVAILDDINLSIDQAMPLGLIVNELVSNSLKHAFRAASATGAGPADGAAGAGQANEIWITAARRPPGRLTLEVGDTGAGLPDEVDLDQPPSMGLQLVQSFVMQLKGRLTVQRRPSAVFTILLPDRQGAHD